MQIFKPLVLYPTHGGPKGKQLKIIRHKNIVIFLLSLKNIAKKMITLGNILHLNYVKYQALRT